MDGNGDSKRVCQTNYHPKRIITEAAAAARKGSPPPPELQLAWRCERYHCLPRGGGIVDQEHGQLEKMTTATNIYNACKAWKENSKNVKWQVSEEGKRVVETINAIAKMEQDGEE